MYWRFSGNRFWRDWTVVSKHEALQNPYYGFGGWVLFFYVMGALGTLLNLGEIFLPPEPGTAEIYGGDPEVARGVHIAYGVIFIPFIVLAPLKHRLTPFVWVGVNWIGAVIFVGAVDSPDQLVMIGISLTFAILMTWYVLNSKRVNVTFLSRVPVGFDPVQHKLKRIKPKRR